MPSSLRLAKGEIHLHFCRQSRGRPKGADMLARVLPLYDDLRDQTVRWSAQGKPFLPTPYAVAISHSEHLGLVAIVQAKRLGCDLQFYRSATPLGLLRRYFHRQEVMQLTTTKKADSADYFYRLWCLKESRYKAAGELLGESLRADLSWVVPDSQSRLPALASMTPSTTGCSKIELSSQDCLQLRYWAQPLFPRCHIALALKTDHSCWCLRYYCHAI